MTTLPYDQFLAKISGSYSVILVSLGDISPNTILDAIRYNKPFIVTKETGLYDRIKDISIFVDPKSQKDIAEKVLWLSDPVNYREQQNRVENFNFSHSWEDITEEYMAVYNSIK
jgi:glycosyltransferase involved in cell wall biosynthesis